MTRHLSHELLNFSVSDGFMNTSPVSFIICSSEDISDTLSITFTTIIITGQRYHVINPKVDFMIFFCNTKPRSAGTAVTGSPCGPGSHCCHIIQRPIYLLFSNDQPLYTLSVHTCLFLYCSTAILTCLYLRRFSFVERSSVASRVPS